MQETGQIFSASIERARQIERSSLSKMRNSTWGRRMKKEMNVERKENLLSPGTRNVLEQYITLNANRPHSKRYS